MEDNINNDIAEAVKVMRAGGVILYPTDTIWGIGCDATNAEAVAKVYKIKRRDDNKALIVLTDSDAKLERYIEHVPELAYTLIELSEKPMTIIYSGAKGLADNLLGDNNSIGIRITKENFSKRLCERMRCPIVSTSANISGEPSAATFDEISEDIKNSVDYIVSYRQQDNTPHVASSIIMLSEDGEFKLIRN